MALSTLNPVRLVSFEFKAPAPSIARRAAAARPEPAQKTAPATAAEASMPYRVEPMLLLHQEQAETMRRVAGFVGRAIQTLLKR